MLCFLSFSITPWCSCLSESMPKDSQESFAMAHCYHLSYWLTSLISASCHDRVVSLLSKMSLPLQCTELPVTDIPSAAATASSQSNNACLDERPGNSLHEPPGGPSTSDASSQSSSPSKHALPRSDSEAAPSRGASVGSARSSTTEEAKSTLTHYPSAAKGGAASSSAGNSLAESSSEAASEAESAISSSPHTQHSRHSGPSMSSSKGSSKGDTSGRISHCHIDWDADDVDSHHEAVRDESGATDSPVSTQTNTDLQQKPYVLLAVSLKNGKVSHGLTVLSMPTLLQQDALRVVALTKMHQTSYMQLLLPVCSTSVKLTGHTSLSCRLCPSLATRGVSLALQRGLFDSRGVIVVTQG